VPIIELGPGGGRDDLLMGAVYCLAVPGRART
jgi:hypothetical protein